MQLKVVSTLVFASLAAALALPPTPDSKGNLVAPPKDFVPPPTSTSLPPPPPKTGVPPAGTPVPRPDTANTHNSGKEKNGNTHLARGDADLSLKKDVPPKGVVPPPTSTPLPPPPPKTGVPPAGTPVPRPDTANTHNSGKEKNDNTHLARGEADLSQKKDAPPKGVVPPPTSTPLPPPPPKTGVPPAGTPVPRPDTANTHNSGKEKNDNTHLARGDGDLSLKKDVPPKGVVPPPTSTPLPPPPPKTGVPPAGTPVPRPDIANTHNSGQEKNDNTHVPRGDGDLSPKKDVPPKGVVPPPTSTPLPPPPPKTGAPPAGTPVPRPDIANNQKVGQEKTNNLKN